VTSRRGTAACTLQALVGDGDCTLGLIGGGSAWVKSSRGDSDGGCTLAPLSDLNRHDPWGWGGVKSSAWLGNINLSLAYINK
jgi:hypothetical protein